MGFIQKYINLYLHKLTTQNALWQRYTNSRLILGVITRTLLLIACAMQYMQVLADINLNGEPSYVAQ